MEAPQNQFRAGPSALGYLYQCRIALLYLLQRLRDDPDTNTSIERFDDVAFENDGSPFQLIQTKHHVSASGDLSNASRDLWKTLRVWMTMLNDGAIQVPSVMFALVTTGLAPEASAASLLRREGRDPARAAAILFDVASTSKDQSNAGAYELFKSMSPELRKSLLDSLFVLDRSPSIKDIRSRLEQEVMLGLQPAHVVPFTDRLEGWWFGRVIGHLAGNSGSPILGTEVIAQLSYIRDQFKQDNLPVDFIGLVPLPEIEGQLRQQTFVAQLRLIALSSKRITYAVVDYYRAFHQRSRWIREQLLLVGDLVEYEKRLLEEWERHFARMIEDLPELATDQEKESAGRTVLNWAEDANIPIRPECREPYIQRGSYHMLADDGKRVGWHPEFRARLEALLQNIGGSV